jgi:hypothetical protein
MPLLYQHPTLALAGYHDRMYQNPVNSQIGRGGFAFGTARAPSGKHPSVASIPQENPIANQW